MGRLRRKWTAEEHVLLGNAVSKAQEDGRPLIWHEIAACVPGRTNKDCRKRWYGKTASKVIKGPWTASEDERLFNAVKKHGTKWSAVAPEVRTRTGDQCSKRWSYTINPDIDRSPWTPKEDQLLLDGVIKYGRNWQQIKSIYFPRRTSLGAKNRYHLLRRRSNGARSYSKSPFAQVLDTVSNTVDRSDESLGTDQPNSFDSRDEIDEDMLKQYDNISAQISAPEDPTPMPKVNAWFNVQHDSRALDADMSNSLSDERSDLAPKNHSYGELADPGDSAMQCTPFSSVDLLSSTNVVPSARRTHQPFRQTGAMVPLPLTPPSAFGETVNNTAHDMDDFTMDFSPDARAAFSWEDQALYDAGMLFPSEPRVLGLGASFVNNDTSIESSAAVVPFSSEVAAAITPVATPIGLSSAAAQSSLSSPACQPAYSSSAPYSSASGCLLSKDKCSSGDNTQRITIEAVCFKDDLGTIVQAVTELSLSTVFKTYD